MMLEIKFEMMQQYSYYIVDFSKKKTSLQSRGRQSQNIDHFRL